VIAVTATDADDKVFQGANRGSHIAVAAPGVDILLPAPAAAYQVTTGTSFAAAEVSGVVALILERKPDLGPEGVRKVLTGTARDLGPEGGRRPVRVRFGGCLPGRAVAGARDHRVGAPDYPGLQKLSN
jgi:subtilisin family serine protease